MSWQSYVDNLMADDTCQDSAIVGYMDNKSVWAAYPNGAFKNITTQEIDVIVGKDRETFFINGLTLGSKKCSVIRDLLYEEDDRTMDLRTKSQDGGTTYNISVGRGEKALVFVMGKEAVHCGCLDKKAKDMADYLKKAGF